MRTDLEALLDAIDERTVLVPLSYVLFKSAYIQKVPAIIEKAQRVGARVILDCYQAAGTVPLEIEKLGAEFAVGGSVAVKTIRPLGVTRRQGAAAAGGVAGQAIGFRPQVAVVWRGGDHGIAVPRGRQQ